MELYQNLDMLRRLKLKTAGTKTGSQVVDSYFTWCQQNKTTL